MTRRSCRGLLPVFAAITVAGCGGGGGGGGSTTPPPPPPVSTTYGITLTALELTRTGDGAAVPVSGLPLDSNITILINE